MDTITRTSSPIRNDPRVTLPPADAIPDKALAELVARYSDMCAQERFQRGVVRTQQDRRPAARDEDSRTLAAWVREGSTGKQPTPDATSKLESQIDSDERLLSAVGIAANDSGRAIPDYQASPAGAKVIAKLESSAIEGRRLAAQAIDTAAAVMEEAARRQSLYEWAVAPGGSSVSAATGARAVLRAFANPAARVEIAGVGMPAARVFASIRPDVGPDEGDAA